MGGAADPGTTVDLRLARAAELVASDPVRAEPLAREVLADIPDHPSALALIASSQRARGEFEAASAILAPLAEARLDLWLVQFEWGQLLMTLGRSRDATLPLSRAVELNPTLARAWRLLGDVRLVSGDAGAAQVAYDWMLWALMPDERLRRPAKDLAEKRLAGAEQALRALLGAEPGNLPAAHLMAEVLARRGDLTAAAALLAECLAQAPNLHLARQSYALVLHRAGRPLEALAQLEALLAREPANHRCRMIKAAAATEVGDYAAAAAVTATLLQDFPDQPHPWLLQGHGLRTLGETDAAVTAYKTALALDPNCAEAWWSLANLKTYRFAPDEIAAMTRRLAERDLDGRAESLLRFACAKVAEDQGRYPDAFADYARANAMQRALRPYDPSAATQAVRRARQLFSRSFFAARRGWGTNARDPIFIVGLPRSGSTLVDQILTSHSAIEGAQELSDLQAIADELGRTGPGYPERLATLGADELAAIGRTYLATTHSRRGLGRPRFTDKAPWNFFHVGLIQLALPNAAIIDVRRHPLAWGVSTFRQHFEGGSDFAYDLADLGRYYRDYVELMDHFDHVLPGRVCRVAYEALLTDTEAETRRLLDHLDLPFEDACLRFFENPRPVATPSSEQVRGPIRPESADEWRRFDPWLEPLKAALGPALRATGPPYPAP